MQIRFLLAAACGTLMVQTAPAEPPTDQDEPADQTELIEALRGEVAELRSTVVELKAQQDPDRPLTEARAAEIRMLVNDVLADADTRASLLAQGMTAGWDNGFKIGSADGNYLLKIGGQIQYRFALNAQDGGPAPPDTVWGSEIRRAKMVLEGHVMDPSWEYLVQGAFDRTEDGEFELEDATITKSLENGMAITVGQFKGPFLREELVSSKRQLAVERSLVNEHFNQDRTIGVLVGYEADSWRAYGSVNDGFGNKNDAVVSTDPTIGLGGRFEYLVMGEWSGFKALTSPRGSESGVLVGGALHYEYHDGSGGAPDMTFVAYTIDAQLNFSGANVFAYFAGISSDNDGSPTMDQLGFVVQGGYYLTDDWEAFARYEWGDSDTAGEDDLNLITLGVNHYIMGHNIKWTTDFGFGLTEVGATWASSGADWRADSAGNEGQLVLRSQVQLVF